MTIKLYKCGAENRQVDKSGFLESVAVLEGNLRQKNVSVINPSITIKYDSSIFGCNYAYIPEFNRYYYIEGFSNVVDGVVDIVMHVDVLMSFKDEFLQNNGYVDTSLNYGNFYLSDENTPVQQNTELFTVKSFQGPFNGSSIIMNCLNTAHQILGEE